MEERLQKILARSAGVSRRKAEELIAARRVRVNGNTAVLGALADAQEDVIELDGVRVREKFRIRWYNDDVSYIALEKKRKVDSLGYKESARLSLPEARAITETGEIEWLRERSEKVCRELYSAMTCRGLRAKVVVSYRREPYIYRAGNVRVTFDSEIRTSVFRRDFFTGIRDISATATPDEMLMEVKYDEYLPEIIADLVQPAGLYRQAFSKYAACRRYG